MVTGYYSHLALRYIIKNQSDSEAETVFKSVAMVGASGSEQEI